MPGSFGTYMLPRELEFYIYIFFIIIQFGAFLVYILIRFCLKVYLKMSFFIYKKKYSDTLAMGHLAPREIFENMLQLMRFSDNSEYK